MKKLSFVERIFSITNYDILHKQICVLGIKIKRRRKKVIPKILYKDLPLENNKIFVRCCFGSYCCNPKYIVEEILKQELPYKIVWMVDNRFEKFKEDFPTDKIKIVMAGTKEAEIERATSKIIIDNERAFFYPESNTIKKEGQIYIQTWHGSLGIKKVGAEITRLSERQCFFHHLDSEQLDYLISNSTFETDLYKRYFYGYGQIIEIGHPKNDILFENDVQNIKDKVYKFFNISSNKKIIIYAPTWRDDYNMKAFSLDFVKIRKAIEDRFGGEYVILNKLHPKYIMNNSKEMLKDEVIYATYYSDMQELLVSADILITDYSSCMFDFMLTNKPVFVYATDVNKYEKQRGLYYPLDTTPFPIAKNNIEMIENIKKFDIEKYIKNVDEFLKEKGCIENGHASERVVDLIKHIIQN